MRRYIQTLCLLLVAVAGLTSCLSDDEETVSTYSDAVITQITLGTLNRYTTTTSATTGNDTVVKTTLTGSTYKMTIDHLGGAIYNRTALPVGTDVRHVVCTISTKNSGVVALKSMTSDSLNYFSSKDSIDFSVPRVLRVYAIDGSTWYDYTVTLNVSETTGVNFGWNKVAEGRADLTGWAHRRLIALQDTVLLADRGTIGIDSCALGGPWLMRLTGSDLETSGDYGATWLKQTTVTGLSQLLGATGHELYALGADGRVKCSTDVLNWSDEALDDDAQLLPADNMAVVSWPYAPADSTDYVLMVGRQQTDDAFCVWRKLSGYAAKAGAAQWVYMLTDGSNRYTLPYGDDLSLAYYENMVFAVTATGRTIYASRDQGITWRLSEDYALPDALGGNSVAMTADGKGRLWVATDNGELWVGTDL